MAAGNSMLSDRSTPAIVAAALWTVPAAIILIGSHFDREAVYLAVTGYVVSMPIAWWLAPRALNRRSPALVVGLAFTVLGTLAGSLLNSLLIVIFEGHPLQDALAFAAIGLILLGLPILILGELLAVTWVAVVRRWNSTSE